MHRINKSSIHIISSHIKNGKDRIVEMKKYLYPFDLFWLVRLKNKLEIWIHTVWHTVPNIKDSAVTSSRLAEGFI